MMSSQLVGIAFIAATTCATVFNQANAATITHSRSFDITSNVFVDRNNPARRTNEDVFIPMTPFDSELGRLDSVEFILSSVLRNSRWAPESYGTHSIAVTAFEKFGSGPAHSTAAGITKLTVSDSISGDLIQQQYSEDLECMVTGGVGICRDHTLNDTAYNGNNILLDHLTEYENPYDVILNQTLDLSLLILAVGVNGDGEASIRSPWLGTLDVVYTYAAVPVPATIWLFGSASLALFGMARRKK